MNDVLAQLSSISVDEADLSTDSAKKLLNAAINSGGFVSGSQLLPSEVIAFNGVFRGIALMIGGELRGPAVEFKSSYAQMPEDQLMQLYQVHPEANSGGGSGGQSKSKSGGSADDRHNSQSEKMKKKITSLYKSQYFFQPKMTLAISQDMLQLSPQFQSRCDKVSYSICVDQNLPNCSKWIDDDDHPHPGNNTDNKTNMTLGITAILSNVQWLSFSSGPIQPAFEDAAANYFASVAGAKRVDVKVSTARPGRWYGGDRWTQVLLQLSLTPATISQYASIMKMHNKGRLDTGLLQVVEAARGMSDIRIPNQTDPSKYLQRAWTYFIMSWEAAEASKSVKDMYQVYEPDATGLLDPVASSDQLLLSLMYDYGTHICPKVTLGGWWRITANYASTVSQERLNVEQAATSYIKEAEAESWAYDANAGGAYRGISGGASGGQGSSSGSGKQILKPEAAPPHSRAEARCSNMYQRGAANLKCQLAECDTLRDADVCCQRPGLSSQFQLTFQVSTHDDAGTDSPIYARLRGVTEAGKDWAPVEALMSSADDDFKKGHHHSYPYYTEPAGIPAEICVENKGNDELRLEWVKVENTLPGLTAVMLGWAKDWPALSSDPEDQDDDTAVSSKCLSLQPID
eukprot:Skav223243  [mRNA]  locus=scaffold2231:425287:429253:+ [translate_table: standard]